MLDCPERARQMGAAAAIHVRRAFSVEAMARGVEATYADLLSQRENRD
jgi:hypothetical protein